MNSNTDESTGLEEFAHAARMLRGELYRSEIYSARKRLFAIFTRPNKTGQEEGEALDIIREEPDLIHVTDSPSDFFGAASSFPLHYAAHLGWENLTGELLQLGAKADARNGYGETALHWSSSASIGELLLEGTRLEDRDDAGWTPLFSAARDGRFEAVKFLVDRGADVHRKTNPEARFPNQDGSTPLHVAVLKQRPDVVRFLLAYGADPDAKDANGRTPFDYCRQADSTSTSIRKALEESAKEPRAQTHSKEYEQRRNATMQTAIRILQEAGLGFSFPRTDTPFSCIRAEMERLRHDARFSHRINDIIASGDPVLTSLQEFVEGYLPSHRITWQDVAMHMNSVAWKHFFVNRWYRVYMTMDSPLRAFLRGNDALFDSRRLPLRVPAISSVRWLFNRGGDAFWNVRHGLAHSTIRWENRNDVLFAIPYERETGLDVASVPVERAEAFAVVLSSFWVATYDCLFS